MAPMLVTRRPPEVIFLDDEHIVGFSGNGFPLLAIAEVIA
jgi:hypothetical protein